MPDKNAKKARRLRRITRVEDFVFFESQFDFVCQSLKEEGVTTESMVPGRCSRSTPASPAVPGSAAT